MPLIPARRRQGQADIVVQSQPGLYSNLQDCQGYTEKLTLEQQRTNKQKGLSMLRSQKYHPETYTRSPAGSNEAKLVMVPHIFNPSNQETEKKAM